MLSAAGRAPCRGLGANAATAGSGLVVALADALPCPWRSRQRRRCQVWVCIDDTTIALNLLPSAAETKKPPVGGRGKSSPRPSRGTKSSNRPQPVRSRYNLSTSTHRTGLGTSPCRSAIVYRRSSLDRSGRLPNITQKRKTYTTTHPAPRQHGLGRRSNCWRRGGGILHHHVLSMKAQRTCSEPMLSSIRINVAQSAAARC